MIVLSRKAGDAIVIADEIIVTVVEIRGDKVRIGVEAPKEVPVYRKEVFEAIGRNQETQREESPPGRWRFLRRFFGR